jgi:hypothetical protein
MTRKELEAIKRRCEAASPSPWKYEWSINKPKGKFHLFAVLGGSPAITNLEIMKFTGKRIPTFGNAEFIAAARTDVPALVAEVERLRGLMSRLCKLCDESKRLFNNRWGYCGYEFLRLGGDLDKEIREALGEE